MRSRSTVIQVFTAILPGSLLIAGLYLISLHSYLLFHSIIELFSIIVASSVFMITWNARSYINNNYLLFIGIASIFVALLDLIHTLAYKGMDVFANQSTDLPTQLWIAARYLQSFSLLIAPFLLGRKLRVHLQLTAYAVVTGLLIASIFYWRIFPVCYVDGVGLTPFKIFSEYLISFTFIVGIALLLQKRQDFDPNVLHLIGLSVLFTVGSEITFTSYVSVYGSSNLIGHLLRLVSFYFLYKAIIETSLVKPNAVLLRNLKRSEDQLREHAGALQIRNQELDAFSHTVAHDLKNPLAAVITASDVILRNPGLPKEELQDFVQEIKAIAFSMSNIIDSLLLLSEVRKVEIPLESVEMSAVVTRVLERLEYMIKDCRAEIILPETWPEALGYAPWLEEVWANYISNALKYGGQPPRVQLGASVQADGMIRFWARDNGPGLLPEAQARLFVPFTQLRHINGKGHGLGLSIVRRIVEKFGGQVGVESETGKGSLFFFTLHGPSARENLKTSSTSSSPKFSPSELQTEGN